MNFYLGKIFQNGIHGFVLPSLFVALTAPGLVYADDHTDVEKIEVVGSHIKRTDMEGPSPIVVIDREHIEMTGYDNLSDVIGDLTISSLGSLSPSSLSELHVSGVTIRSFGPEFPSTSNVLLLLDGMPLPEIGGLGGIDINSIPIAVIERVEILKDGASAIYGSNAVAGAINIVTKDSYSGAQMSVAGELAPRKEGNTPGAFLSYLDFPNWDGPSQNNEWDPLQAWRGKGDKLSADAFYGGTKGRIKYLGVAQLRLNTSLYLYDRTYGKPTVKQMSKYSSPGNWINAQGETVYDPSCPQEKIEKIDGVIVQGKSKCKFDWSPYMQYYPTMLHGSLYGKLEIEMDNDSLLKGSLLYNYSWSKGILAPGVSGEAFSDLSKSGGKDNRMSNQAITHQGLSSVPNSVEYRTVEEIGGGPRISINNTHIVQLQTNYKKLLGDVTEFDAFLTLAGAYYLHSGVTGFLKISKLHELLNEGKWKIFNKEPGKRYDVSSAEYIVKSLQASHLLSFEPRLTGELLDIDSRFPLSYSVGAQGKWQNYIKSQDPITALRDTNDNYIGASDQWGGGEPGYGDGNRLQAALYGELLATPFDNKLEIQLAGRSDYYNDMGITQVDIPFTTIPVPLSPKLGLSFQPIDSLKLRGTLGKSFQAPSLSAMYQGKVTTYPKGKDQNLCTLRKEKKCEEKQYMTHKFGAKGLKPETSQNLSFGLIFDPTDNLFFNLDFFHLSAKDIINSEASINELFALENTPEGKKLLKDNDITIHRIESTDPANRAVEYIDYKPFNAANAMAQGFDIGAEWRNISLTSYLDLGVKLEHSHNLYLRRQNFKGGKIRTPAPYYGWLEDLFGSIFNYTNPDETRNKYKNDGKLITATDYGLPRWKNTLTFTLLNKNKGHKFEVLFNNFSRQLKESLSLTAEDKTKELSKIGYIDYFWTIDARASLFLTKKSRLVVGVRNLLGFNPPINDQAYPGSSGDVNLFKNLANVNDFLYSIRGRVLHAKYSYTF